MRQKSSFIERREKWLPLPETNIAHANWWLEDEIFFQDSLFSGAIVVSGSVICSLIHGTKTNQKVKVENFPEYPFCDFGMATKRHQYFPVGELQE